MTGDKRGPNRQQRRLRRSRSNEDATATNRKVNYSQLKNPFPVMDVFSTDEIANMHESAVRIYNDMVEKTRLNYLANVKQAKSQVIEISAALVCGLVVVLALVGLS